MRRLNKYREEERGAVGVAVGILLVVLLGFVALALDVGRMYVEKAQLQNGADAIALSIAHACAQTTGDPDCAADTPLADSLANANSNDELSEVEELIIDKTSGTVTILINAHEPGRGPNEISLSFARILGINAAKVDAKAKASWGGPAKGRSPFSIAFSKCEVDSGPSWDGAMQFIRSHGVGTSDKACTSTSSGQELPGGFGWLVQEPELSCSASITLSSPLETGDPGSNFKTGCEAVLEYWKKQLEKGEPVIAFFPVFDKIVDGQYRIEAFAAFDVRGWNFYNGTGKFALPEAQSYMPSSGYSETGFIGKFVEYVAIDDSTEFGGSTQYGAKIVSLTE